MLFQATLLIDLMAMATTLWMAFYLFARGFPSTLTLRVVVVSLALSGFFFGAYENIFVQVPGTAAIRAVLLVIALAGWYGITYQVISTHNQRRLQWVKWGISVMGAVSILVLLQPGSFIGEAGNALHVAHMNSSPPYIIYSIYQFLVSFGIMLNLLVDDRVGLTSRGKYYLAASVFPVLSVMYGILSLAGATPAPRIIQDTLAFMGIIILNMAVARHQLWMERRATVQDFPLTTLAVLGLATLYGYVAWRRGMPVELLSEVVGLAIITLGLYDLTREFLERLRIRNENLFRKQLRQLNSESNTEDALKIQLQNGLDLLCQALHAPGGFVAVRQGDNFVVTASRLSVPIGSEMSSSVVACEDVSQPKAEQLSSLAWIAPSFEGQTQVAVVGIEKSASRLEYSTGNLELLAEVADQVGTIVSMSNARPRQSELIRELVAESQASATELNFVAGNMLDSISIHPDVGFIKMVEDALRHLPDRITLGQSALAEKLAVQGDSHIDRGKHLQQLLVDSIESLKPLELRPSEPLPRAWYNYAVLHDAYVEGVQNREIMARLYISEGTFNRTRRNAVRGLARLLVERTQHTVRAGPR